jgi:hypothetical protein
LRTSIPNILLRQNIAGRFCRPVRIFRVAYLDIIAPCWGKNLRDKSRWCPEAVARLLGDRKPFLMITDPPYGIELDSEWRDGAGLNGCGLAEASYMKYRTEGHTNTSISSDTRADWSEAFELVPSLQIAYVWHASVLPHSGEVPLLPDGFAGARGRSRSSAMIAAAKNRVQERRW